MTLEELLKQAAEQLEGRSESPRLDAEVLLARVLGKARSYLYTWPDRELDETCLVNFQALLEQRMQGRPVAHITRSREFWSLPLTVNEHTLIPRPDTERLVEAILDQYPAGEAIELADLGTGSGAIALAIATERPGWHILATDRSADALAVARANAERLQVDNVEFAQGSWCQPLAGRRFHIIVSNPPYIAAADPHLDLGDVRFEPRQALVSGSQGLDDIRTICSCTPAHLYSGGLLILEHGFEQQQKVQEIFTQAGFKRLRQYRDLASNPRATSGIYS